MKQQQCDINVKCMSVCDCVCVCGVHVMFGQCWYVPIANCKRHVRVHSSHPTADKHALATDTPHPDFLSLLHLLYCYVLYALHFVFIVTPCLHHQQQ